MIEHVVRRASVAPSIDVVAVATDDDRIAEAVDTFGGTAIMTRADHQSGTDRLAEVAASLDADVVVNVQGDEPLLDASAIEEAVAPLLSNPDEEMSTLRKRIDRHEDVDNPSVVKVVVDRDGHALYFSRQPIPYVRAGHPVPPMWRHIGLYAYRRVCLLRLAQLPQTRLELAEGLEQLRALEHGIRIKTIETHTDPIGVDTPEDLERVRRLVEAATVRP
jgi:3-deoxy-manno-octulosonate cytidylyltransferase (CMP-KDO synthetase)